MRNVRCSAPNVKSDNGQVSLSQVSSYSAHCKYMRVDLMKPLLLILGSWDIGKGCYSHWFASERSMFEQHFTSLYYFYMNVIVVGQVDAVRVATLGEEFLEVLSPPTSKVTMVRPLPVMSLPTCCYLCSWWVAVTVIITDLFAGFWKKFRLQVHSCARRKAATSIKTFSKNAEECRDGCAIATETGVEKAVCG